jgi:hypothetical protein
VKSLPLAYIRSQFETLGYAVITEIKDPVHRGRARYQTAPIDGGGSHGFFAKKSDLLTYLERVRRNREA